MYWKYLNIWQNNPGIRKYFLNQFTSPLKIVKIFARKYYALLNISSKTVIINTPKVSTESTERFLNSLMITIARKGIKFEIVYEETCRDVYQI